MANGGAIWTSERLYILRLGGRIYMILRCFRDELFWCARITDFRTFDFKLLYRLHSLIPQTLVD